MMDLTDLTMVSTGCCVSNAEIVDFVGATTLFLSWTRFNALSKLSGELRITNSLRSGRKPLTKQ